MAQGTHSYRNDLDWVGNLGQGSSRFRACSRNHVVRVGEKPTLRFCLIACSVDFPVRSERSLRREDR
jgi:hypothetical protein